MMCCESSGPRSSSRAAIRVASEAISVPSTIGAAYGRAVPRQRADQRAAGHAGRAARCRAARASSARRRRGCRPRAARPSAVTMHGTGFSECAVFGEPSSLSMWSALPWSAVISSTPPDARDRVDDLAEAAVDGLDRLDRGGDHARVADHVGVREVDDPEARRVLAPGRDERRRRLGRAHLRLVVVGRHVARARHELAPLAVLRRSPRRRRRSTSRAGTSRSRRRAAGARRRARSPAAA